MSQDEIKLVLMSVGVTIAVISLFLTIRNRIIDRKRNLKITHTIQAKLTGINLEYSGLFISIYFLNTGNIPLFINRPYVKIPYKIDGLDQYEVLNLDNLPHYPLRLESGEKHSVEYNLVSFLKNISFLRWYRRIHFEAQDSRGHRYKSKKIWFKYFLKQEELHARLSK